MTVEKSYRRSILEGYRHLYGNPRSLLLGSHFSLLSLLLSAPLLFLCYLWKRFLYPFSYTRGAQYSWWSMLLSHQCIWKRQKWLWTVAWTPLLSVFHYLFICLFVYVLYIILWSPQYANVVWGYLDSSILAIY